MEDVSLDIDIRKIKRGYSFYDRNNQLFPSQNFYNKEDGMRILQVYFYDEEIISVSKALSLLNRITRFRALPITIKVKDQLQRDSEALDSIYDFFEELKFLSFMMEGEEGLPKLKILKRSRKAYIVTERFVSDPFRDKTSGLLILQDLLKEDYVSFVQSLKLKNDILSSTLPKRVKPKPKKPKVKPFEPIEVKNIKDLPLNFN